MQCMRCRRPNPPRYARGTFFRFDDVRATSLLRKVTVTMGDDQELDGEAVGHAEMARQ